MKNIFYVFKKSAGMTLTEIMLAMALLASAFIPIVGVMGTSIKATDKDDRNIKAVNLCQDKLNRALQFPFDVIAPGSYGGAAAVTLKSNAAAGAIILQVGPETIDGVQITSQLVVQDVPGVFVVPTYDPFAKGENPNAPAAWGWSTQNINYAGLYHKYTMTITWKDKGDKIDKFYTLASHKAKIRR